MEDQNYQKAAAVDKELILQPPKCARCDSVPKEPYGFLCCQACYCHECAIVLANAGRPRCIACCQDISQQSSTLCTLKKGTDSDNYESPIHVEAESPFIDCNSRDSSSAGSSQESVFPPPNSKPTKGSLSQLLARPLNSCDHLPRLLGLETNGKRKAEEPTGQSCATGDTSTESITNIFDLQQDEAQRIQQCCPKASSNTSRHHEPQTSSVRQPGALQTNAPFDHLSLRYEASRAHSGPRGKMISLLDILNYELPENFFENRDPMSCSASLNNHDPSGFLIDLPHGSPAQYKQLYDLAPLGNSANLYLRHSNILALNGCAMYGKKIVGLFMQPIKNKLSRYLFAGERYSLPSDLLRRKYYFLSENFDRTFSTRILVGYCRDLARVFEVQSNAGLLTAPITFEHLCLVDDPSPNTLKVPILPCTGNPYETTEQNRFFVDSDGSDFSDYGAADIAFNWAKVSICILSRKEPDFDMFDYDKFKKECSGIVVELLVTISTCLDRNRAKRPTMKHVLSQVEGILFPQLLHGEVSDEDRVA